MPVSVHDVAALLIEEQHAAGRAIDKMQLEKDLYLVQGANLLFWGEPAFREPIHAFRNGPVVRGVEATYRHASAGRDPLPNPRGGKPDRVPFEVAETVRTVLRYFGEWTGPALEQYVKQPGSPWRKLREHLPPSAPSAIEMPLDLIREWFAEHGINPAAPPPKVWEPTDEERQAADERLRQAKAFGAFVPKLTPEVEQIAARALARLASDESSGR